MGLKKYAKHIGLNKARQVRGLEKTHKKYRLKKKKKKVDNLFFSRARARQVWSRAVGHARLKEKNLGTTRPVDHFNPS